VPAERNFDRFGTAGYPSFMIFADFGRGRSGGGGHRSGGRGGRGGFTSYPAYIAPDPYVVVAPATVICTARPNPIPPCVGTLVWRNAKTVCCGR
jgi:hypothetical protein